MPKRSPARQASTQHRPLPKRKDVLLVRASASTDVVEVSEEEEVAEQETTESAKAGTTKAKPATAAAKPTAQPTTTAGKRPAVPAKPGAQRSGRPVQRGKVRTAQRLAVGRQANLVSAEHYRYVLKDLRLIGILAAFMFAALIALAFILPNVLKY